MIKKLFNKKWKIFLAVILVISISLGIYFFTNKPAVSETRYITSTVTKGTISESVSASGNFIITKQKNLNFKAGGKITELNVKVGDSVKAGQELGKVDDTGLQNTVIQSQTAVDTATNNFNNRNKSAPTTQDIANLQEQINLAQIKVNTDKNSLNNYILNSPQAGCVREVNSKVGDTVSTGGISGNFIVLGDDCVTTPIPNSRNVNFSIGGKLTEIDVAVGQTVSTGKQLARIDNTTAVNQLAQSQSSLNQAINNYNNRNKNLPNDYDVANLQAQIDTSQLKLDTDKASLQNVVLTSDIDGLVTAVNNTVGDTVSAGGNTSTVSTGTSTTSNSTSGTQSSGVVTVIDLNSLMVSLTVPESDAVKIKPKQLAQITVDALSGKQFVGKVVSIDTIGTNSSNVVSFTVKIGFDKLDEGIKPGMSASSSILVNTKDNILIVPSGAVKTVSGQKTVQTYNDNNLQTVPVQTGLSDDTNIEITNGLSEGDLVVTSIITGSSGSRSSAAGGLFNLGGTGGGNRGGATTTSRPTGTGAPAGGFPGGN